MNGFVGNLEQATEQNGFFRHVLYTAAHSQLVVMALLPGEEIGMEVHPQHDQFIRFETGKGKVILGGEEYDVSSGYGVVIPAGVMHNVVNSAEGAMKLYTIYTPPEHKDGTIHKTKAEAVASHEM